MAYGFLKEMSVRYPENSFLLWKSQMLFDCFPFATFVQDVNTFVVHGGIPTVATAFSDIENISKQISVVPGTGIAGELLWNDPLGSRRQGAKIFSVEHVRAFMELNRVSLIIRSHECKSQGFEIHSDYDNCVYTVFSAGNYANQQCNNGAIITIDNSTVLPVSFKPRHYPLHSNNT
jgi:serine/threonine-protein phosphatase 5